MNEMSATSRGSRSSQADDSINPLLDVMGSINPKNAKSTFIRIVEKKDNFEKFAKLANGKFLVAATQKQLKKAKIVSANAQEILQQVGASLTKDKLLQGREPNGAEEAWIGVRTIYMVGKKSEKVYGLFGSLIMKLIALFVRIPNLDTAYAGVSKQFTEALIRDMKKEKKDSVNKRFGNDDDMKGNFSEDELQCIDFFSKLATKEDIIAIFEAMKNKKLESSDDDLLCLDGETAGEVQEKELANEFLKKAVKFRRYDLVEHFSKNYKPDISIDTLEVIAKRQDVKGARLLKIAENPLLKFELLSIARSKGIAGSHEMLAYLKPSEKFFANLIKN